MKKGASCSGFPPTFDVSVHCSRFFAIFIFPKNSASILYVFCRKILYQFINSVKFGLLISSTFIDQQIDKVE